jgi:hypothetical protein
LIELLRLLIAEKVDLNGISEYQESGLRVLSRLGRFDGVKVLLTGGADAGQLRWSPLMHTVTLGTLDDVRREVANGAALEERDWWERTPWPLALQTGDVAKAQFLLEQGADPDVVGRCQKPPLVYPIESFHASMLQWLVELGIDIERKDEFGHAPLSAAVQCDNVEAARVLLGHGADMIHEWHGQTVLAEIESREMGTLLLKAGADTRHLNAKGRRLLIGLSAEHDALPLEVTPAEFRQFHLPRFGTANPEPMSNRFYEEMIRSGMDAFHAAAQFEKEAEFAHPVWCALRFGQTLTFLGDGRAVQIGGEHEDFYDPDFYIYNDVFVHRPGGAVEIYGYPKEVFPPTDFHTATLAGDGSIWIVGGLGYNGERAFGTTPVHRLDITTMRIERVDTSGSCPGWIHRHTAVLTAIGEIKITGGEVIQDPQERGMENRRAFLFDTASRIWREAD